MRRDMSETSIAMTPESLGHLIEGQIVKGTKTVPVISPKDGSVVAQRPDATLAEMERAMAAAKAAQPTWAALGLAGRRKVLEAMAAALEAKVTDIWELSAIEKGAKASSTEALIAPSRAKAIAKEEPEVEILEDTKDRTVKLVRKPLGVVVAISPWNAPVLNATGKIFTALLMGNTVVFKPSPFTSMATLALGSLWVDIVPPGVVNIIAGGDDIGAALVAHPDTAMITFTGSVAAGQNIARSAGGSLKRVLLELGGNDAAIVLPDVDVRAVAQRIYPIAFGMSGQICAAVKRLYVHESIYDEMVNALSELAQLSVALPEDEGGNFVPLTTAPQFERIQMLAKDAIAGGAVPVSGGEKVEHSGFFFPPTVLTHIKPDMKVWVEEQFGPLLPVVSFSDVEDAIRDANATEYGLCGSVWTSDVELGAHLADRLECGTTWVNNHAETDPAIPFGGAKQSGIGRANGRQGLDAYAELQTQYIYKAPERVLAS
jgi:acyl-CoA reductase-like NAD-dependent aldehyde dehydrogenase